MYNLLDSHLADPVVIIIRYLYLGGGTGSNTFNFTDLVVGFNSYCLAGQCEPAKFVIVVREIDVSQTIFHDH